MTTGASSPRPAASPAPKGWRPAPARASTRSRRRRFKGRPGEPGQGRGWTRSCLAGLDESALAWIVGGMHRHGHPLPDSSITAVTGRPRKSRGGNRTLKSVCGGEERTGDRRACSRERPPPFATTGHVDTQRRARPQATSPSGGLMLIDGRTWFLLAFGRGEAGGDEGDGTTGVRRQPLGTFNLPAVGGLTV